MTRRRSRLTRWPRGTLILVMLVTVLAMLVLMRAVDVPANGAPYDWINRAYMMRGGA
jgi:hypothetical protein